MPAAPLPTGCCQALATQAMPPATVSTPSLCTLLSPEGLGVEEAELQGLCQLPVHQAVPQEGSAPAHGGLQLGGEGIIQACHASLPPHTSPPAHAGGKGVPGARVGGQWRPQRGENAL